MNSTRPRPIVLIVLDGFAERDASTGDAVRLAHAPVLSSLEQHRPWSLIETSGPDAGLPPGWGDKIDGFLGVGAGRVALTDISRIDSAVQGEGFTTNDVIRRMVGQAKDFGGRLHLIGLVSDGCAHSSLRHLLALVEVAQKARVRVVVHAILDGLDVPPRTAPRYVADLESRLAGGVGRIGTVGGRFWGMDGDKRWDRVQKCYRAILAAEVSRADSALRGIEQSYDAGKTDEIVEPFVVFDYPGVSPVDVAIHFNFRPDGARELTYALGSSHFDHFTRKGGRAPFAGRYACLTTYDDALDLPIAFPKEPHPNILPELLSRAGCRQFRCAEAESYARVTRFFNGFWEEPFEGEDRTILSSPAGASEQPEMAARVAQAAEDAIRSGKYDFALVHFAKPYMTGSPGVPSAGIHAVDASLGKVVEAARSAGGAVVIMGNPGIGERAQSPATSQPQTAVTLGRVPLVYVNDADPTARIREGGRVRDVAPTLLDLLRLPQPIEMTGGSLLDR